MRIKDLQVVDLRNLDNLQLNPSPGMNIITGPNASGKTAILEAIYLLSRGRSFRTSRVHELIRRGQSTFRVTATLADQDGLTVPLGIERDSTQLRMRHNASPVRSLSEHARRFPVVLITPDSHSLMAGKPGLRRHWLDWAMFHVEPDYLEDWRTCFHALRQRNALLKRRAPDSQLIAWERILVTTADRIDRAREGFCQRLTAAIDETLAEVLPGKPEARYWRGWDPGQRYGDILESRRQPDRERGFTGHGPHRADLEFRHDTMPARSLLSRGQTKLYIAGLALALARVLIAAGLQPVILVDDLTAELDAAACSRLLGLLGETDCQLFITTIDAGQLPREARSEAPVFHMEHGNLAEVVQ